MSPATNLPVTLIQVVISYLYLVIEGTLLRVAFIVRVPHAGHEVGLVKFEHYNSIVINEMVDEVTFIETNEQVLLPYNIHDSTGRH